MNFSLLDLTIIIPTYNTRELLRNCLTSIYHYTRDIAFEVICIDDNSHDSSADMVAEQFPQVRLVRNTIGKQYAANNNIGLRMARGRYACLLNSDTEVRDNAFSKLVAFMDSHPDVAACGPKLLNPDLTIQHCIRRFPHLGIFILQALGWQRFFPSGCVASGYYATDFDYSKPQAVESIGTTAYVLRRETWEAAGLLDEDLRLFLVDLAYNFMLNRKGHEVFYTPCAEVIHFGSQTVNQNAKKHIREFHESMTRFCDHYDYFSSNRWIKFIIKGGIKLRYALKLLEYYFSRDKRVIKGPGAPRLTHETH